MTAIGHVAFVIYIAVLHFGVGLLEKQSFSVIILVPFEEKGNSLSHHNNLQKCDECSSSKTLNTVEKITELQ